MGDVMECGCRWHREPGFGDVLTQCVAHKAGARYEGGEPDDDVVIEVELAAEKLGLRTVTRR